jgi:hypothetical protein
LTHSQTGLDSHTVPYTYVGCGREC